MATDFEALLERVQRLEDLEAVRTTWLNYCNRLDAFDFDGLGDVFALDATLEVGGLSPALDGHYESRRTIVEDFYRKTDVAPSTNPAGLMTGHLSTNMQIELDGNGATTLAYFFEIVDNNLALIGTYQHRMRREVDRWRIAFLRISIRYRGRLEVSKTSGQSLTEILARPV